MREIIKGRPLSAATLREMAQAIAGIAHYRSSNGRSLGSLRGSTLVETDPFQASGQDQSGILYCSLHNALGMFEIAEIEDTEVALVNSPDYLVVARKVFRWGTTRVGILQSAGVVGDIVPVRISGVSLVKYIWPTTVNAGDRLIAMKDEPYAYPCRGGNLKVMEVATHDPSWSGYNMALVHITGERLDSVFVADEEAPT